MSQRGRSVIQWRHKRSWFVSDLSHRITGWHLSVPIMIYGHSWSHSTILTYRSTSQPQLERRQTFPQAQPYNQRFLAASRGTAIAAWRCNFDHTTLTSLWQYVTICDVWVFSFRSLVRELSLNGYALLGWSSPAALQSNAAPGPQGMKHDETCCIEQTGHQTGFAHWHLPLMWRSELWGKKSTPEAWHLKHS